MKARCANMMMVVLVASASVAATAPPVPADACAMYHAGHRDYDPSGCILMPDGVWHIFPDNDHWGHCTSPDLFHWNCSHPSTGFDGDTGSITVTPAGIFALWPSTSGKPGVLMATPTDPLKLDIWTPHGMVGVPPAGVAQFRDPGRALQLKTGWYIPAGVSGPGNKGGGIHWFRDMSNGSMKELSHTGWLFHTRAPNEMECPDVFMLDGKAVVLVSTGGMNGWSDFWVGDFTADDLHFEPRSSGRLDHGANGISTIYAAKTGTNAQPPFSRRVLFGFGGWSEKHATACGNTYLLPKELALSPAGELSQRPVAEVAVLRKSRVDGGSKLAAGAQLEVLASCAARAGAPARSGMIGVRTLVDAAATQGLSVGFNFTASGAHGFAAYDAALGQAGAPRVDKTQPLQLAEAFKLRVFVDGHLVETFLDGSAVITSVTANRLSSQQLGSIFVNSASPAVECNVTSWVLGL